MSREIEPVSNSEETLSDKETVEFIDAWKLTKFTEEVNKVLRSQGYEDVVAKNTLNNYFKDLEERLIHYVNRQSEVKVYTELDLKIATYIIMKRKESGGGMKLDDIYQSIANEFEVRSFPEDSETPSETERLAKTFNVILEKFEKEITMKLEQAQQVSKNATQLLLERSIEGQEKQIVKKQLEILTLQKTFKKEAIQKWSELPTDRRYDGIFFKREKLNEREEFIDEYVEKKMMEWFLTNQIE